MSPGNVRRDTRRKPTGGSLRTHLRILGGVLAGNTSTCDSRFQRVTTVDEANQELAKHGLAHHVHDDEQLPIVR